MEKISWILEKMRDEIPENTRELEDAFKYMVE